jgi:hypothetical protein
MSPAEPPGASSFAPDFGAFVPGPRLTMAPTAERIDVRGQGSDGKGESLANVAGYETSSRRRSPMSRAQRPRCCPRPARWPISGRPAPQVTLRHPAILRDYVVTTLEIYCYKTRIIRYFSPRQRYISLNNSLLLSGNALLIPNKSLQISEQIHILRAFRMLAGHSETRIIRYTLPQDQGGVAVSHF